MLLWFGVELVSCKRVDQKIIIGTHTTGTEQNYLLICKIKLPNQKDKSSEISNFYYPTEVIENYKKIQKK